MQAAWPCGPEALECGSPSKWLTLWACAPHPPLLQMCTPRRSSSSSTSCSVSLTSWSASTRSRRWDAGGALGWGPAFSRLLEPGRCKEKKEKSAAEKESCPSGAQQERHPCRVGQLWSASTCTGSCPALDCLNHPHQMPLLNVPHHPAPLQIDTVRAWASQDRGGWLYVQGVLVLAGASCSPAHDGRATRCKPHPDVSFREPIAHQIPQQLPCTRARTFTHAHSRTNTHTHTHAHVHTRTHTRTYTHSRTCTWTSAQIGDAYLVSSGILTSDAEGFRTVDNFHNSAAGAGRMLALAVDMMRVAVSVGAPRGRQGAGCSAPWAQGALCHGR